MVSDFIKIEFSLFEYNIKLRSNELVRVILHYFSV